MNDLPILLFHVDRAMFPDLEIEEIVDDVWDFALGWVKDPLTQKFKIGMTFVLQFWSSDDNDRSKPKTEKKYARYWIEVTKDGVRHELLGEYLLTPVILYTHHL